MQPTCTAATKPSHHCHHPTMVSATLHIPPTPSIGQYSIFTFALFLCILLTVVLYKGMHWKCKLHIYCAAQMDLTITFFSQHPDVSLTHLLRSVFYQLMHIFICRSLIDLVVLCYDCQFTSGSLFNNAKLNVTLQWSPVIDSPTVVHRNQHLLLKKRRRNTMYSSPAIYFGVQSHCMCLLL